MEEPDKNTKAEGPPKESTHNTFVKILFHHGITGLVLIVLLMVTAIKTFWKEGVRSGGIVSYVLVACASILVGNNVLNAMLEDVVLVHLSVVLSLGMAAVGVAGKNIQE